MPPTPTAVLESAPGADAPAAWLRNPLLRWRATSPTARNVILAVVLMALTAGLRLVAVGHAYDMNQDEVDYVLLGVSFLHGQFPPVFPGSGPFLLHPPMFFALEATWHLIFSPAGNFFHLLVVMRMLNSLCAAVSAGCLFLLGTRLANRTSGVAVALLFALDPYILRENGKVMLETSTIMFVLLGYVVLVHLWRHRRTTPAPRTRGTYAWAAGAGLLLGVAVMTKDMAALLVYPPLVVLVVAGWGVERRISGTALAAAFVPYSVYLVALSAVGGIGAWWVQETAGLSRFGGAQKSTGFSKAGSPSLTHTMLKQIGSFGTTYLLIVLSLVATLYLLFATRRADRRFFAVVSGFGAVTVFYALFFGTIEAQFLYYLLAPAFLTLVIGTTLFVERRRPIRRFRQWRSLATLLLAVICLVDLGIWAHTRTRPDNGEQRIAQWFHQHAPHPGLIDNDTQVTVYALKLSGFQAASVGSLQQAAADHIRYLTVLPVEVAGNYANLTSGQEQRFIQHGRRVFSFYEPTYGNIQIYETTDPRIW